jgi:hypothetical protein
MPPFQLLPTELFGLSPVEGWAPRPSTTDAVDQAGWGESAQADLLLPVAANSFAGRAGIEQAVSRVVGTTSR